MLIIGLIGGVASGKSAVAAALARRGAVVFDADEIGHDVLAQPEVRDELVARWGAGSSTRRAASTGPPSPRIVFGDSARPPPNANSSNNSSTRGFGRRSKPRIRQLPADGHPGRRHRRPAADRSRLERGLPRGRLRRLPRASAARPGPTAAAGPQRNSLAEKRLRCR